MTLRRNSNVYIIIIIIIIIIIQTQDLPLLKKCCFASIQHSVTFSHGVNEWSWLVQRNCTLDEMHVNIARCVIVPVFKQYANLVIKFHLFCLIFNLCNHIFSAGKQYGYACIFSTLTKITTTIWTQCLNWPNISWARLEGPELKTRCQRRESALGDGAASSSHQLRGLGSYLTEVWSEASTEVHYGVFWSSQSFLCIKFKFNKIKSTTGIKFVCVTTSSGKVVVEPLPYLMVYRC